jgi:hypothetical protein
MNDDALAERLATLVKLSTERHMRDGGIETVLGVYDAVIAQVERPMKKTPKMAAEISQLRTEQDQRRAGVLEVRPTVTRLGAVDMQVCVPAAWTDEQVKTYANGANECGTDHGWHIRKQGDPGLAGADERVACEKRDGYVHLMLDA